jgi:hypothetical protein
LETLYRKMDIARLAYKVRYETRSFPRSEDLIAAIEAGIAGEESSRKDLLEWLGRAFMARG